MTDDPALIAKGLTNGSKTALLQMNGAWQTLGNIGPFTSGQSMKALAVRGLARKSADRGKAAYHATPLGLAVRAELEKEKG